VIKSFRGDSRQFPGGQAMKLASEVRVASAVNEEHNWQIEFVMHNISGLSI
jgi:hypothetical protein